MASFLEYKAELAKEKNKGVAFNRFPFSPDLFKNAHRSFQVTIMELTFSMIREKAGLDIYQQSPPLQCSAAKFPLKSFK